MPAGSRDSESWGSIIAAYRELCHCYYQAWCWDALGILLHLICSGGEEKALILALLWHRRRSLTNPAAAHLEEACRWPSPQNARWKAWGISFHVPRTDDYLQTFVKVLVLFISWRVSRPRSTDRGNIPRPRRSSSCCTVWSGAGSSHPSAQAPAADPFGSSGEEDLPTSYAACPAVGSS